jgi:hypothetical protein
VEAQAPRSRLSMWSISMPACKSPHLGGGGFVGGHMRLGHSPCLHNAGGTISFRGAEMHFVRMRLRTSHVCLETILAQPRYGSARSKAGDLASRQEGATAEKAVPFSELRLSIVVQTNQECARSGARLAGSRRSKKLGTDRVKSRRTVTPQRPSRCGTDILPRCCEPCTCRGTGFRWVHSSLLGL